MGVKIRSLGVLGWQDFSFWVIGCIDFYLIDIRVKVVWNDGSGVDRERGFQPSR